MYNRIEYRKFLRSEEANRVISNYVNYIRKLVVAKRVLRRRIGMYNRGIQTRKELMEETPPPFRFYLN